MGAAAGERPFVSVIVPVYNDAENLGVCLEALGRQTYPCRHFEVVVVDNGSDDDVEGATRRFARVRLVRELRPGSYAARNAGIRASRGDLFAFTDSDCVPADDWLERGVATWLERPSAGLLGGRIVVFPKRAGRPTPVEIHQAVSAFDQRRNVERERFAVTANLFTSRSAIERVGAFDDRLRSGGDKEWGRRVHACGLEQRFAEAACVRHPSPHTLRELAAKYRRVAGGLFQLAGGRTRRELRLAAVFLAAPLAKLRAYWSHPGLASPRDRLVFLAVEVALAGVRLAELVRLELGGAPRRR